MYNTRLFIGDSALLLTLGAYMLFVSDYTYICMLPIGLLMIVLTLRSLSERQPLPFLILQLLLSVTFAALSGGLFEFLILSECRFNRAKYLRTCLPSATYCVYAVFVKKVEMPLIICGVLILAALSLALLLLERLAAGYVGVRSRDEQTVRATAVNEMYEKKLNQELTIKSYLAEKNARFEERENISRNIHNSVGHSITAAIMTLDAADMLYEKSPELAREKMNTANERIRSSLDSIRRAVRVLDSESSFVSASDFVGELTAVIDGFTMDTTVKVRSDFSEIDKALQIPHEHTEFLTGAVQELMSNGVRHGRADRFIITLAADSLHIKLTVSDNGNGDFSENNRTEKIGDGFGLKKIYAYAKKCGGTAAFVNSAGFKSEITLPLIKEENNG